MTATRKVDPIRGDRAIHGLPSSAYSQIFIDPTHFTLLSVTELAVETRYSRALSFAFKQGYKKDHGLPKCFIFSCDVFSTVSRLSNSKCRSVEGMRKEHGRRTLHEKFRLEHAAVP